MTPAAFPVAKKSFSMSSRLECGFATVFVADPNSFCDIVDKNLAVSDVSSPRRRAQCLHYLVGTGRGNNHLNLHLRQKINVVLLPAVNLFVALLTAMTADFRDGHAVDANPLQCLFYLFQFEGLDNRFDLFHSVPPSVVVPLGLK